MSQFSYDLAAAYRIYSGAQTSPGSIFAKDKFKMVELCFNSFKNSLGGLRVKLWVILNDCPPEYEAMIKRVWGADDLVLVRFPGVSNTTTLYEASRILMDQTDAEIVYFSDDDYVYLPGQFPLAIDFLRQNADADFITLYDHPDVYTTDLHNLPGETRMAAGKNWISCISTCHTFLAKRAALIELRRLYSHIFRGFQKTVPPDLCFWMALTKKRVFNPVKFIQWSLTRRWYWAASIFLAWFYFWRQILFGRRYSLWQPRPSIATHMSAGLEAPGIDWQKEFQRQMAGIRSEARKD
jgi:hypothetical protein